VAWGGRASEKGEYRGELGDGARSPTESDDDDVESEDEDDDDDDDEEEEGDDDEEDVEVSEPKEEGMPGEAESGGVSCSGGSKDDVWRFHLFRPSFQYR
jgi:hypothetical protein